MQWIQNTLNFIYQTLLGELITVVTGVIVANFLISRWENRKFGGWSVVLRQNGNEILRREISPRKARAILEEPADLSVYLKGVASPYAFLKCDLLKDGKALGLLIEDHENNCYILDLDKNPHTETTSRPMSV